MLGWDALISYLPLSAFLEVFSTGQALQDVGVMTTRGEGEAIGGRNYDTTTGYEGMRPRSTETE